MLLTLGVSHKTAPIDIREKLAFSQEHIPNALRALMGTVDVDEVALLSTCNRTELYCSSHAVNDSFMAQLVQWWQKYHVGSFDMSPYLYTYSDEVAVSHMMRVASGLDSMVLGESQILGQLKTAFQTAHLAGGLGRRLSRLFQTSFSVAKRVRHSTQVGAHPVSVAYAAVSLARQIFTDLSKATVMLIGAGENIELTLTHLSARKVKEIFIVNRTFSHAQTLATKYNAKALPLEDISKVLSIADIVISSITCSKPILSQAHVEQATLKSKRRPIFMVDLGVPRNIEPAIGNNEDIYLYTVDDLQGIVTENFKNRQMAAKEAEMVINEASQAYMNWIHAQEQMRTVRALRNQAEKLKNESLHIALKRLQKGENPEVVLTHFAHQLTQKLLHQPTIGLKDKNKNQEKIELVKELFSIEYEE